jgi:dihydroorotate dehydrogenase (NAD+) catalytic subunit
MRFTIPSGIITTHPASAVDLIREVPEYDYTTKSISKNPRIVPTGEMLVHPPTGVEFANREPIITGGAFGLGNAVGLSNPGKDEARTEIIASGIPKERIRASIFGKTPEDFREVAKSLEDCVSSVEENLSCPHSEKHGIAIGQDPEMVARCVKEVVSNVGVPVWTKFGLMPNLLESIAAARDAGAYGIVLLNTEGPYCYTVDGNPILYNGVGGMSGPSLFPKLVTSIRNIRSRFGKDIKISACGGIRGAREIKELRELGVDEVGIGTALIGQTGRGLINYFRTLVRDCENGTDNASGLLKQVDMTLKRARISRIENRDCDLRVYKTDTSVDAIPGQFAFLFLPGSKMPDGKPEEKPFSILNNDPLSFMIQTRGRFTGRFNQLEEGEEFYYRGLYGQGIDVPQKSDVVLVGGGCGIAGLYLFAKSLSETNKIVTLLGAKDKQHLPYIKEFESFGEVHITTEDGSIGRKGLVTDLLKEAELREESYFLNCGPKAMVEAVLPLELKISSPERVYSSVDYMTRCGVGICGSCADKKGRRTCVEGPFVNP